MSMLSCSDKNNKSLLQKAYAYCEKLTRTHYENFPVGSYLLPKKMRVPVTVVYAFGRSADDIADEGDLLPKERLARLQEYRDRLLKPENCSEKAIPSEIDLIFLALHDVIAEHQLPITLFLDLLSAFEQDITQKQYQTLDEVKEYCNRSANTIGKLLLYLAGYATPRNLYYADCICTAIQLNNFLQDLESDLRIRERCYLPLEALQKVGLLPEDLKQMAISGNLDKLSLLQPVMETFFSEIERLLDKGKPLIGVLKGRLAFELRLTMVCAYELMDKLKQRQNCFVRPVFRAIEWPRLLMQAWLYRPKLKSIQGLEHYTQKNVAKQSGFYSSLLGLSAMQKQALITLYQFCREVDDIVDECHEPALAEIKIHFWVQEIERVFLGNPQHPIGKALADIVTFYPLQQRYFKEILNGMLMDLEHTGYATFELLSKYCHAVASCVGLLAIEIFGFAGDRLALENYARNLGIALQLVNIIRDVGEDVRMQRIYLPEEDLLRFSVTRDEIQKGIYSDRFQALMQYQADRAKEYYQKALQSLPVIDYPSQQPGLIMAAIYFDLLHELELSHFQVLHQKIKLTSTRKLVVAFSTILKMLTLEKTSSSEAAVKHFCGQLVTPPLATPRG